MLFKKIGLPAIALLGMLAMAPHQAKAAVRFGVVVGRPAYAYPVYPVCLPAVTGGRDISDRRGDGRFRAGRFRRLPAVPQLLDTPAEVPGLLFVDVLA